MKVNVKSRVFSITDTAKLAEEYGLITKERVHHILYGEAIDKGGHIWPGNFNKTAFPASWSAEKMLYYVLDIATDPKLKWVQQDGKLGTYLTKAGNPAKFVIEGVRENVVIRIVVKPMGEGIITAFPKK